MASSLDALRWALSTPAPSQAQKLNQEEAHAFYRTQCICFGLIQLFLNFAEAGRSQDRYALLNLRFPDSDLLASLFAATIPSSYEIQAYGGLAGADSCIDARNKSLVTIVRVLSAPDGMGAWINHPHNNIYVQQWISAIARWNATEWQRPWYALFPSLLYSCTKLFDPPPPAEDPSGYWRSDDAQQVAVVGVWQEWMDVFHEAAESSSSFNWSDLSVRILKVLALLRTENAGAAAESHVVLMLHYFRDYMPMVQDPQNMLPPVKAALEAKRMEIERYKMSRANDVGVHWHTDHRRYLLT